MKTCPFCSQELSDAVMQCRACGRYLLKENSAPPEKWYFKTPLVILAFLSAGPFALPLVWFHPRYPRWVKLLVTLAAAAASYFLFHAVQSSLRSFWQQYDEILKLLKTSEGGA